MFTLRQTAFVFFLLLGFYRSTDGLKCYSCTGCNDASELHKFRTETVPDDQDYSCAKYWSPNPNQDVMRYPLKSCVHKPSVRDGTFCCKTDLCNHANHVLPRSSIVFYVGFTLIVIFLQINIHALFP